MDRNELFVLNVQMIDNVYVLISLMHQSEAMINNKVVQSSEYNCEDTDYT